MASSAGSTASTSTPRPPPRLPQPPHGPSASSPVFLNVYDVTPANGYARWLGLGVYHSGVQVHGVEYAYGAHEGAGSGIFEVSPRRCPGYAFRESVLVGSTELGRAEVRALMGELAADFPGDAYNLVSRNCNHFCDAACRRLVARARIPRWVNRLAKIGVVFTCVIPSSGGKQQVRRKGEPAARVRSRSARHAADAGAATARPKTFFRSLSVGGSKNVTPSPLPVATQPQPPTQPRPRPAAPPALTVTPTPLVAST
ncbi:hypothetical protein ACQ4PT_008981 [Festuca glaucescens]